MAASAASFVALYELITNILNTPEKGAVRGAGFGLGLQGLDHLSERGAERRAYLL